MTSRIEWDAADYARNSQGQFGWAMANIDKLSLLGNESVLDVGCGDGKISLEIANRVPGGSVTGIDSSEGMIANAVQRAQHTHTRNAAFQVMDAQAVTFSRQFDAVFSNSAMHWMPNPEAVIQGIARALKVGGRLVLSMGGRGTAAIVFTAIEVMAREPRWAPYVTQVPSPHRFLGPQEYEPWLASAGLTAMRVELVCKPMRHRNIEALEGWLRTTWMHYTERVPLESRIEFIRELAQRVEQDCAIGEDGDLLMPMVNLEVEARL